jgi:hypothetical protein
MPANPFNAQTDHGIGIGLRVPHYRHILEKKAVVDWFEIISENFMADGGRPLEVLGSILATLRRAMLRRWFGAMLNPMCHLIRGSTPLPGGL